jgi:hypothetical protein
MLIELSKVNNGVFVKISAATATIMVRAKVKWYSHSGHLEKRDIETKQFEVRDDNKEKDLFKTI